MWPVEDKETPTLLLPFQNKSISWELNFHPDLQDDEGVNSCEKEAAWQHYALVTLSLCELATSTCSMARSQFLKLRCKQSIDLLLP